MRAAYSGADLTVLPSFEEGFGLPVIESMACGTPVACSNTASLPEVAGDAAEYFVPSNPESIAAAIEDVVLSQERWRELQIRGLAAGGKVRLARVRGAPHSCLSRVPVRASLDGSRPDPSLPLKSAR